VGVNGFLALAPTTGSTLVTNADLKAATGLPTVPLIAPFWTTSIWGWPARCTGRSTAPPSPAADRAVEQGERRQ